MVLAAVSAADLRASGVVGLVPNNWSNSPGWGDRHHENYIVANGNILPIDISYLFWPENDAWLAPYIQAGITEINVVNFAANPDQALTQFFDIYFDTLSELNKKKSDIIAFTHTFFNETPLKEKFDDTINKTLPGLLNTQTDRINWYKTHLATYDKNKAKKEKFLAVLDQDPSLLDTDSETKMYYLADKDYHSAFFLKTN